MMTEKLDLLTTILDEKLDEMKQTHEDEERPDYYRAIKDVIEVIELLNLGGV